MDGIKFPKEIYFVAGWKNRLYYTKGHVKQALQYNESDRVFKMTFNQGWGWVEVTEEFK